MTVRNMANRSEKSRSNVLSIQNFVVWIQATHNNIISDQRKKLSQFFFKYFFDVPHSATFIFIIFMCAYVIANIHPVPIQCRGLNPWPLVCDPNAFTTRPGVANLFHKWAKILIKKVQGAKFLIKNPFWGPKFYSFS